MSGVTKKSPRKSLRSTIPIHNVSVVVERLNLEVISKSLKKYPHEKNKVLSNHSFTKLKNKNGKKVQKPSLNVNTAVSKPKVNQMNLIAAALIESKKAARKAELEKGPVDPNIVKSRVQDVIKNLMLQKTNQPFQIQKRPPRNTMKKPAIRKNTNYVSGQIPWTSSLDVLDDILHSNPGGSSCTTFNPFTTTPIHPNQLQTNTDVNFEDRTIGNCDFTNLTKPVNIKLDEAVAFGGIEKAEKLNSETEEMEDQDTYLDHVKSEEYCDLCGSSFSSAAELQSHKRLIHNYINQPEMILGDIVDGSVVDDENQADGNSASEDDSEMLVYPELTIKEEKCEDSNEIFPTSEEMEIPKNQLDSNCNRPIVVTFEKLPTVKTEPLLPNLYRTQSDVPADFDVSRTEKWLYNEVLQCSPSLNQRSPHQSGQKKPRISRKRRDDNEPVPFGFHDIISKLKMTKK